MGPHQSSTLMGTRYPPDLGPRRCSAVAPALQGGGGFGCEMLGAKPLWTRSLRMASTLRIFAVTSLMSFGTLGLWLSSANERVAAVETAPLRQGEVAMWQEETVPELAAITSQDRKAWQGQRDSNPRPSVLETDALPTELYP